MEGGRISGGVGGEGRQEEETPKDEVDALGWKKKKAKEAGKGRRMKPSGARL